MALFTVNIQTKINLPPSVIGDNTINVLDPNIPYVFTLADFTTGTTPQYVDPENDVLEKIKITTLETVGSLLYNGVDVTLNQEIVSLDISGGLLTYVPVIGAAYLNTFEFDIADIGSSTYSGLTPGIMTMDVVADENQPPTDVGDGETTVAYGEAIIFTRAMFTTLTTPPYSDPEGDIAFKLKILSLPELGELKLDGVNITVNQVILFTDIDDSLLTYVPDLADTDGDIQPFNFAIADEGSEIFVE